MKGRKTTKNQTKGKKEGEDNDREMKKKKSLREKGGSQTEIPLHDAFKNGRPPILFIL